MPDNIDQLQIEIKADSKKADKALENLTNRLVSLSNGLKNLGTSSSGMESFSKSVGTLTSAMVSFRDSGVTKQTFNSLEKSLSKLGTVDSASIMRTSNSMYQMSNALGKLTNLQGSATQLKDLANSIGILGSKKVQTAISNMPQLGNSLNQLMTTLKNAPQVSQNLIDMTNALGNFASQGKKVGTVVNSLTRNGNSGKTTSFFNNLFHSTRKTSHGFKSLASSIGTFYVKFWMVIRGMKKLNEAVKSSMDYIEAYNFFDVASKTAVEKSWRALGKDSAEAYLDEFESTLTELNKKMTGLAVERKTGDFSVSPLANLGINLTQLTTFESEIVSITSSLGLMGDVSLNTSKALTMLAADMSSLHNIDLSTVFKNFQSGLIGQSRAMYKYGIDITNATLSTYALANGVTKSVQSMTQAEKMQLRTLAIFQQLNGKVAQSENAWGDLARTMDQPSNQLRRLQNGFKNLGMMIGKLFLPIVQKTLPYLNGMVIVFQRLAESIANFFGVSLEGVSDKEMVSDIWDEMEEDAEDTSDAIAKLNKQLATFDKLNNLTSSNKSGISDTGEMIDLSSQIAEAVANYEKVWNEAFKNIKDKSTEFADAVLGAFKKGDYKAIGKTVADSITKQLKEINWENVYKGASSFGSSLANFLNGLIDEDLFDEFGVTLASVLNTQIYSSLDFAKTLDWNKIGKSFSDGLNGFFKTFDFKSLAQALNEWVDGLEKMIGSALAEFDWKTAFKSAYEFVSNLEFDTIAVIVGTLTIKKVGKIAIGGAIGKLLKEKLGTLLAKVFSGVTIKQLGISILSLIPSSPGGWDALANGMLDDLEETLNNLFPTLYPIFGKMFGDFLVGFVSVGVASAGNPIAAIIGGLFTSMPIDINWFGEGGVFSFDWAEDWFDHAKEAFETAFDGNRADIMDIGSWIFEGIADGFVGALVFITEPIARFFDEFVKGIKNIFGIHSPAKEMKPYGEYILLGVVEGFTDSFGNIKTAIGNFFDIVEEKFGLKECKNAFKNLGEGIKSVWNGAIEKIKSSWNALANWMNEHIKIEIPDIKNPISGKTIFKGSEIGLNIPTFATGGFPYPQGENGLFYANSSELVGKFSNGKTAVANNQQITDGIEEAAYRGFMRAMGNSSNTSNVNITLEGDAQGLFKVVRQQANSYEQRTGNPAFGY